MCSNNDLYNIKIYGFQSFKTSVNFFSLHESQFCKPLGGGEPSLSASDSLVLFFLFFYILIIFLFSLVKILDKLSFYYSLIFHEL